VAQPYWLCAQRNDPPQVPAGVISPNSPQRPGTSRTDVDQLQPRASFRNSSALTARCEPNCHPGRTRRNACRRELWSHPAMPRNHSIYFASTTLAPGPKRHEKFRAFVLAELPRNFCRLGILQGDGIERPSSQGRLSKVCFQCI